MPNEPSMEEILSSIKRIIAEEDGATTTQTVPRAPRRVPAATAEDDMAEDQVLELTNALPGETEAETAPVQEEPVVTAQAKPESKAPETKVGADKTVKTETKAAPKPRPVATTTAIPAAAAPAAQTPSAVMSDLSAQAARESLSSLSKLLIRPEDGQSNTLEGLVSEMLRPMLKEWLDTNLPDMVEGLVKREIDRITGRV